MVPIHEHCTEILTPGKKELRLYRSRFKRHKSIFVLAGSPDKILLDDAARPLILNITCYRLPTCYDSWEIGGKHYLKATILKRDLAVKINVYYTALY